MKLLLTHRFYWPDSAPYGAILRRIAGMLAEHHAVEVFAGVPSYREGVRAPRIEQDGAVTVRRTWVIPREKRHPVVRALNVLIYCGALFLHVLRVRPDVVMAATFPPVLAAWSAALAARLVGARFVYHCQDIHPEVSRVSGGALGRGLAFRLLRWLDNQTLRRAGAIVVLSEDMADTLRARGLGPLPIHVINNVAMVGETAARPDPAFAKPAGRRRVIFAGNLGVYQELPLLAEGVAKLFPKHPDLELCFIGSGAAEAGLKAKWEGHAQVRFVPFLPFEAAKPLMAEADLGLVSLLKGMTAVAYPSKLLTYQALGLPVLALVEPESALARGLEESGTGVVARTRSAAGVAEALERALADPEMRARAGEQSEAAQAERAHLLWTDLMERLK